MSKIKLNAHPLCRMRDSNDQNPDWRQPSEYFDIEAAGRNGRATVKVGVDGYWSDDLITLYVERRVNWRASDEADVEWLCTMSHSSGGRLTKADDKHYPAPRYRAIADDLEAEECFGAALMHAAALGRLILQHKVEMECFYQQRRVELKAEAEAERQAKLAKIEADAPLGPVRAADMMRKAAEMAVPYKDTNIMVWERGFDHAKLLSVSRRASTRWRYNGNPVSQAEARRLLAEASERSNIKL